LAHDHVVFAWSLLKNLQYNGKAGREILTLRKSDIMDDLRVLDLYEEAIAHGIPLPERQGNWVQKYRNVEESSLFVTSQFSRYQEVEMFIEENFKNGFSLFDEGRQS